MNIRKWQALFKYIYLYKLHALLLKIIQLKKYNTLIKIKINIYFEQVRKIHTKFSVSKLILNNNLKMF